MMLSRWKLFKVIMKSHLYCLCGSREVVGKNSKKISDESFIFESGGIYYIVTLVVTRESKGGGRMTYTTHDHYLICELFKAGLTIRQIGNKMELSTPDVSMILDAYGLKRRRPNDSDKKQIVKLIELDLSDAEIGRKTGFCPSVAYRLRRKLGLSPSVNPRTCQDTKMRKYYAALDKISEGMSALQACQECKISTDAFYKTRRSLSFAVSENPKSKSRPALVSETQEFN